MSSMACYVHNRLNYCIDSNQILLNGKNWQLHTGGKVCDPPCVITNLYRYSLPYVSHLCYVHDVRLPVCLCVCPSVTLVDWWIGKQKVEIGIGQDTVV